MLMYLQNYNQFLIKSKTYYYYNSFILNKDFSLSLNAKDYINFLSNKAFEAYNNIAKKTNTYNIVIELIEVNKCMNYIYSHYSVLFKKKYNSEIFNKYFKLHYPLESNKCFPIAIYDSLLILTDVLFTFFLKFFDELISRELFIQLQFFIIPEKQYNYSKNFSRNIFFPLYLLDYNFQKTFWTDSILIL